MTKKIIFSLMLANLLLTGCWDSVELNDIAVVTGMAIDPGENTKYRLTLEYVNPAQFSKQAPEQGAPVTKVTLEGNSLSELSRKMNVGVSRKLIFSHTRVLFISEAVAKKGLIRFLDALDRSAEFRNDFNILVTRDNAAEKFTMITDPIEKIPSLKIQKQIESFVEEWGGDPQVRLTDFLNAVTSQGRSPVISTISIKGNPDKGKSADANMSIEREAMVFLDGLAVFKEDLLIGYLTLEDTRNYLWTQDLKSTSISFPCGKQEEEEDETNFVVLSILNSSTKMETIYRNNRPVLKLNLYVEADLSAIQCGKDLTKMDTYNEFEKKAAEYIDKSVTETINKVQTEYETDIFGFGEALDRNNHKKFKEVKEKWDEEFSRADVEVSVTAQIRRAGTRSKSFLTDKPKFTDND